MPTEVELVWTTFSSASKVGHSGQCGFSGSRAEHPSRIIDRIAEPLLRTGLVFARVIEERPALLRFVDAPASENRGKLGNIGLSIPTIGAERVEFHYLTSIVFVQSLFLDFRFWIGSARAVHRRVGTHGYPVVEVEHHGGRLSSSDQEVSELAESMGDEWCHVRRSLYTTVQRLSACRR